MISYRSVSIEKGCEEKYFMVLNHRLAFTSTMLSFFLLVLLLTACGGTSTSSSSSSGGGSTASSTPTDTPMPASPPTPTPTPTQAITGPTQAVTIMKTSSGYAFNPDMLTVAVGTTVIWTNSTTAPHTVTSDDGKTFDSGASNPISSGSTFSFKFTKPGTYKYHCQVHPSMMATIVVK